MSGASRKITNPSSGLVYNSTISPTSSINAMIISAILEHPESKDIKIGESFTLTCRISFPDVFEAVPTISWVETENEFVHDG